MSFDVFYTTNSPENEELAGRIYRCLADGGHVVRKTTSQMYSESLGRFLADRFGIKRTYVLGLAGFVTGSFLCGLAPTLGALVVARAVQGLAGGVALPLGTAQLLRAFPANEQGRALGLFGIVLVFAPALGPVLGGALVDAGLWRWIFFVNVPIGALGP